MRQDALALVATERARQDEQWGTQRHGMTVWLAVLMEEVGEARAAALLLRTIALRHEAMRRTQLAMLRDALVQVAAVATAAIEHSTEAVERDGVMPGAIRQCASPPTATG